MLLRKIKSFWSWMTGRSKKVRLIPILDYETTLYNQAIEDFRRQYVYRPDFIEFVMVDGQFCMSICDVGEPVSLVKRNVVTLEEE